ncbi:MAG: hypothetical protein E7200_11335 [Selenomonas ruminantium]|nr:hypothetical protein [Selenomonas ruminantium]
MKGLLKIGAGLALAAMLLVGGILFVSRTESFMQEAGKTAGSLVTDSLGTEVAVGSIEVSSLHDLTIHDINIYDKQAETMLHADEARVGFRLLAAFKEPSDAVKYVRLKGVAATVTEKEDGSWNVQELISSTEEKKSFTGTVEVEDAQVNLKSYRLPEAMAFTQVTGNIDFAQYPVIKTEIKARQGETDLEFDGTFGSDRQILSLKAGEAELENYLQLLPAGLLPQEVELKGGHLNRAEATVVYRGGLISLTGSAEVKEGRLKAFDTEVEKIEGQAFFTDSQVLFDARAEAAGQQTRAHGKVTLLEGTPYLDLEAESDSFDPAAVMANIPYRGAASFKARISGTVSAPVVNAEAKVAAGEVYGIPFAEAAGKVRYEDGRLYVQEAKAQSLGGNIQGEFEFSAADFAYTGHVKAQGVNLENVAAYLPEAGALGEFTGRASLDVGFSGRGTDYEKMEGYGSLKLENGSYRGLALEKVGTSFALQGEELSIDALSARLPNHGDIGMEGKITDLYGDQKLNLELYGGHVELALLQTLLPQADMRGLADFKGVLSGTRTNPDLDLKFSATRGELFKQPFDSLRFHAQGSLDRVAIEDFSLMKDGKQTWYVDGFIGLTGERRLDLRADTVGVRMENLAALVAPDQPITGNVDNTIRFTGTLDNPQAVGYIHFYLGSYMGVLLSGMDGDYYLQDGKVRLQDFHIYSPMVDMDVNGLVDRTGNLDLVAQVHDIDMKRLQHKLPYEVSGHGRFDGNIRGSISSPVFRGILNSQGLVLNGQEIKYIHGTVDYALHRIKLSEFGFSQGEDGYCGLEASFDTEDETISGNAVVENFDIEALCDILNQHNDKLAGKISVGVQMGGTLGNPDLLVQGGIARGTAAGYDITDVKLKGHLQDRVLHLEELSGSQGEGSFLAGGTVDFNRDGEIAASLSAQKLALGMFAKLAGAETDITGEADMKAEFSGYLHNPSIDAEIKGQDGGVAGSTFDTLEAVLQLRNGLCDIKRMQVQKTVGERTYQASAKGIVPSSAIKVDDPAALNDYEQIRLEISLDDADLSLLPALSKQVDWAMGQTQGRLLITGTAAHPQFNGVVSVAGGSLKLKELRLPITEMGARLDFNGTQMTVRDFSGKMGDGSYQGSGSLQLEGLTPVHYAFDFAASRLDVQSSFFQGPLDGEFHLQEGEIFGRTLPRLSGQLDLHDCIVSVPTIPETEGDLPNIILDFQLNVGKNVHFYSSYLYDMYLKGAVHFGGTTRHPKTSGQVEVENGGTVSYLKTPFKIRQGWAYFNQVDSFLPSLVFEADATVGRTKIFLNISGPLGEMKLNLSSLPEHSQTEIMQVLTLGRDYEAGNSKITAGDMLSLGLQLTVLSELEQAVRNVLFLDYFSIHRGGPMSDFVSTSSESNKREDDYSVEIGKYVTDKLMLKFSQGVGYAHKQRYGVEYKVNDRFSIVMERGDNDTIVGFTSRLQF